MARHTRLEILCAMKNIGVVPVFYTPDFDTAKGVLCACGDGGAAVVEFTNRGDRAAEVFGKLAEFRDKDRQNVCLGVGSICDAQTAAIYIAAGADFVVGPVLDEETARLCNTQKIPYCPGCGSATEIHRAHQLGVEICKVFPGDCAGGPAFVKAVKGPMPWAELMPTGGVSPERENLKKWFDAGAACVGMGSKLITKQILQAKDFKTLTKNVDDLVRLIAELRKTKNIQPAE